MKKFYLHDGTEQTGPFDIEELKSKNITKNTSIWHEGLTEWIPAGKIDELKVLFRETTPPPFRKTPPRIQETVALNQTTSQTQTKNKSSIGLIVKVIIVVLFIGGVATMIMNNPNSIPGVKFEINIPKPIVVTSRADSRNSSLLNLRTTVYATVINQGGDGMVLVTSYVYQDDNVYDRSKSIYMRANESQDIEVTFDEVKYLGGDITYNVDAIAQ